MKRIVVFVFLASFVLSRPSAAGQSTTSQQPPDDPLVRVTLPSVTVTAQKEPEDPRRLPVSVTAVTADTIDRAGIRIVSEAAIFAPNVTFTEFTARKLSNPRFRGIGSSPGNPGGHDLHRRRPAAQLELVEHRAPRRRSNRVRARAAECAVRPQHARRPRQRHEPPARRRQVDGPDVRPVRQFLCVGRPRTRVGAPHRRHAQRQRRLQLCRARGLHRQRRHRQRPRLARRLQRQGPAAVEAGIAVGGAPHRQRRARARRRLRAQRSRGAAREPLPLVARLRGLHQPRHLRHDHSGGTDRRVDATLVDHGIPEVEDRGLDRPRLLADAAHHA